MNTMGTVKGGRVWDGVAVQGKAVGGLARAGQVFYRKQEQQEQPEGEIWYLDFIGQGGRGGRITQVKPAREDLRLRDSDYFAVIDQWNFYAAFDDRYQAATLNTFEPRPTADLKAIESDGIAFWAWNGIWADIMDAGGIQLQGRQVRLVIDTRNGAPQNGDIWLEVI